MVLTFRLLLCVLLLLPAGFAQSARAQLLRDLEVLSADDMQGRRPGTPGHQKAQDYIAERFKESGIQPFGYSYLRRFTASTPGANIIGYIPGKRNPDRYLVVTAHYDHLGVRGGVVFNGADDNASGVAGLIALATHFNVQRPDHSIIFAAVDQEETGMAGVRDLVSNPPVPQSAIVMNVNLDMIARDDRNTLYASGAYHYPFLKPYLEKVKEDVPVNLVLGHDDPREGPVDDWTTQSDHVWFHRKGIPFIYLGVEDYEQHHEPTDDFSNITTEFFVDAVQTIIRVVAAFDAGLEEIARSRGV